MTRHLWPANEDEKQFQLDCRERLSPERAQACIDAPHRPTRALYDLANAVNNLPLGWQRRVEIDKSVIVLGDQCGGCERLFDSPVPLFYTRLTARILSFWLIVLPVGLWETFGNTWNHIGLVPCSAILAFFYFGIEELAVTLEEPFSILAMDKFTDASIGARVSEYVTYHERRVMENESN